MPRTLHPHTQAVLDLKQGEALALAITKTEARSLRVSILTTVAPRTQAHYRTKYLKASGELLVICTAHPQPKQTHPISAATTPHPQPLPPKNLCTVPPAIPAPTPPAAHTIHTAHTKTIGRKPSDLTLSLRALRAGDTLSFNVANKAEAQRIRVTLNNVVAKQSGGTYSTYIDLDGCTLVVNCLTHPDTPPNESALDRMC